MPSVLEVKKKKKAKNLEEFEFEREMSFFSLRVLLFSVPYSLNTRLPRKGYRYFFTKKKSLLRLSVFILLCYVYFLLPDRTKSKRNEPNAVFFNKT